MSVQGRFKERYKKGDIPWDTGKPDFNLIRMISNGLILKCNALEVGCGTGDNALWLAQQDFIVTACDASIIAIKKAVDKVSKADVKCIFLVLDFLNNEIPGSPFGFIFDRGCFHSFDNDAERKKFAMKVSSHLKKGGLWLSLIGCSDNQRQGSGPPQHTAKDVVAAVETYFEILSLTSSYFDSNRTKPPKAWVCLMQKREGVLKQE